ncbi:GD22776 [Drosophila simulans]|uniref:GD22776 n=1 Tax=Drosophila simulans TaxID=7240 RepID=B4Q936_DROSI|nr:GD22776 [Drosophila simulans]
MQLADPATTRIPRLDGVSRLPKPSTFGLASSSGSTTNRTTTTSTTQHIRPPTSAPKATQIFRAPGDPAKPRPASSYAPSSAALRDLGSSLKKSASGERINNAVSLLSKRTTTVLKKYFSPKSSASANAVMSSPCDMTSSLPVTPLPVGKRDMVTNDQLTSSTPMPLLRSETFVCEDEEQSNRMKLESTRLSTFGRTMDIDSPVPNETKVLIRDGTRIMKGSPSTDITQIVRPAQKTPLMTFCSLDTTHEMTVCSRNNATHSVNSSGIMGRTMPVIPAKDATRTMSANSSGLGNLTKVVARVGFIFQTLEAAGNISKTFNGSGDLTRTVEKESNITNTFEVAANCRKHLQEE